MFIAVKQERRRTAKGYHTNHKFCLLKCDNGNCQKEFELPYGKNHVSRELHFCTKQCVNDALKKGGIVEERRKKNNLEKWGADHPMKTTEGQDLFKASLMELYGVEHPSSSKEILEIRRQKHKEKTGYDFPMQNPETMKKSKETNLEKYGVVSIMQLPEMIEKSRKTCIEKYGEDNVFKSEHFRQKRKETSQIHYGTDHPMQSEEVIRRAHETKKRNGSYGKSKAEDRCFNLLVELYGIDNVKRQVLLEGTKYPIDIMLVSENLYIQVDGVYWHGLDRPLEVTENSTKPSSKGILNAIETDRKQNKIFVERGLQLIRITDLEVEACTTAERLKILMYERMQSSKHHTP